jgi:DedD protein
MGLAFWRSKKRAANAAAKPATRPALPSEDDVEPRVDPAATLRARARHRLIGAAALLLAVAIVVPMLLDPAPRVVSENIPIDIPSERTPFTPRLALPAAPPTDAPAPPAPKPEPKAAPEAKAEPKAEAPAAKVEGKAGARVEPPAAKVEPKPVKPSDEAGAANAEEQRALAALEGKAVEAPLTAAKGGKFVVQTAAPASEKSARALADRLKKAGYPSYTERVDARDGPRFRVRVGPFATREDAERARVRLKAQGFGGNLVAL